MLLSLFLMVACDVAPADEFDAGGGFDADAMPDGSINPAEDATTPADAVTNGPPDAASARTELVYVENGTFDALATDARLTWYQEGVGGIALFHWNWNSAPNRCANADPCVETIRYRVTVPADCQLVEAHAIVQASNTTVRRRFVHDGVILDEQTSAETLSFEPFDPTGPTYFEYLPDPCDDDAIACVLLVYGQYLVVECPID